MELFEKILVICDTTRSSFAQSSLSTWGNSYWRLQARWKAEKYKKEGEAERVQRKNTDYFNFC